MGFFRNHIAPDVGYNSGPGHNSKSLSFLIISSVLINGFVISADNLTPRGVPLSRAALYDPQKNFSCLDGSKLIPFSFVNDDYCDCKDGSDEPGTSACSRGSFYCLNAGHISAYISSSRVNDGVCDCCDGSDEVGTLTCSNTCEEMGRAAREEAERQTKLAKEGFQKRLEMISKGKSFRKEKEEERTRLDADRQIAESVKNEKLQLKEQVEQPEKEALEKYRLIQEEKQKQEDEQEKAQSENEAETLFNLLDSNGDDKITLDEIKVRQTFDKNKDGVVDEAEAMFFLNMNEEMSKEEFLKSGWLLVKPFFMMEQGMFKPPESGGGQAGSEDYEDDLEKLDDIQNEQQDSAKPDVPGVEPGELEDEEEEEGEEEHDADTDPEPVVDTDPKYDEETQALIDQANKAREEYNEADRNLRESVRKLEEVNELLNLDFGDDDRFAQMHGECYDYEDKEYIYTLCPFKSATQKIRSGGDVNLGKWNAWSGPENDKYTSMLYDRGQSCWNGPQRSAKVGLRCGLDNRLIGVAEPSRCEYQFEFETPASCQKPEASQSHDEL
ncbi:unnamed protein product [Orchesella dallaii]|uniref:Glucosidase 2 subunit beta n=1 Tax=Orchesella dallaii TaxID=48710 RepID=A0ABP1S4C0_9HEXA